MLTGPTRKIIFSIAIALPLLISGCKYFSKASDDQLKEANKLAAEADTMAAKVNDAYAQASKKEDELKNEKKDKARIKKLNEEETALYDQAAKDASAAAEKYESAAKLKVDAKYQDYLKLRAQEMRKSGAYFTALKETPDARTDTKFKPGSKAYKDKLTEIKTRTDKLKKEVDDTKALADKAQKENGDKFKAKS
jgi:hypothetical protein